MQIMRVLLLPEVIPLKQLGKQQVKILM